MKHPHGQGEPHVKRPQPCVELWPASLCSEMPLGGKGLLLVCLGPMQRAWVIIGRLWVCWTLRSAGVLNGAPDAAGRPSPCCTAAGCGSIIQDSGSSAGRPCARLQAADVASRLQRCSSLPSLGSTWRTADRLRGCRTRTMMLSW